MAVEVEARRQIGILEDGGSIVFISSIAALKANEDVKSRYLAL